MARIQAHPGLPSTVHDRTGRTVFDRCHLMCCVQDRTGCTRKILSLLRTGLDRTEYTRSDQPRPTCSGLPHTAGSSSGLRYRRTALPHRHRTSPWHSPPRRNPGHTGSMSARQQRLLCVDLGGTQSTSSTMRTRSRRYICPPGTAPRHTGSTASRPTLGACSAPQRRTRLDRRLSSAQQGTNLLLGERPRRARPPRARIAGASPAGPGFVRGEAVRTIQARQPREQHTHYAPAWRTESNTRTFR
jgi:hypothetical protein